MPLSFFLLRTLYTAAPMATPLDRQLHLVHLDLLVEGFLGSPSSGVALPSGQFVRSRRRTVALRHFFLE